MTRPIAPDANRLTYVVGWCAALALPAAVGLISYREGAEQEGVFDRFPVWAELLFLGGTLGQAVYGRARHDRVVTASCLGMAAGHGIGLALSQRRPRTARLTRPPLAIRTDRPALADVAGAPIDDKPGGAPSMNSGDSNENDRRDQNDANRRDQTDASPAPAEAWKPVAGPEVIETTDPVVSSGPRQTAAWKDRPDSTVVVETNRIREPIAPHAPGVVIVPYQEKPLTQPSRGGGDHREKNQNKDKSSDEDDAEQEKDDDARSESKSRDRSSGKKDGLKAEKSNGKHREDAREKGGKPEYRSEDHDDDREDEDDAQHAAPSMTRILLFAGLVALVCGVAGAFGYSYFFGGKGKSDDQKQSASGGKSSGGGSEKSKGSGSASTKSKGSNDEQAGSASNEADTIPGFTTAEDADSLRKQIGHLTERLDALQHRLDQIGGPRDQTPPDLHTLQIKMGELSRTMDDVASLPSRVHRLGSRLEELQQQIKMVRDRESAREDRDTDKPAVVVDKTPSLVKSSDPAPPGAAAPAYSSSDAPDAALEQAIELFKLGQYKLAANVLSGLRQTRPDDARVWYFSALANGLTTGKWDEQTREYAQRGADRERAGTPARTAIDHSLSGVTRTQGLEWLNAIRNRQGKRALPAS